MSSVSLPFVARTNVSSTLASLLQQAQQSNSGSGNVTPTSSNLVLCNAHGLCTLYSAYSNVGLNNTLPLATLDVAGTGIYSSLLTTSTLSNTGTIWAQTLSNAGALSSSNARFSGPVVVASSGLSNAGTLWTASNALFSGLLVSSAGLCNAGTLTVSNAVFSGPIVSLASISNVGAMWTQSLSNAGALTAGTALFSGLVVSLASVCNAGTIWTQSLSNTGALTASNALFSGPIVSLASLSNAGTMWTQSLSNAGALTASNALFSGPVATSGGLCNTGVLWTQSLSNAGVLSASNALFSGPIVSLASLSNAGVLWTQSLSNAGALTASNALFSGPIVSLASLSNAGAMWTQSLSNAGVLTASNALFSGPIVALAGLSNAGAMWTQSLSNAGALTASNALFSGPVAASGGLSNTGVMWTQSLSNAGVLTASNALFSGPIVALAGLSNAGAMWTQSLSNAGVLTASNALFSGPLVSLASLSNAGAMWTQSLSNAGALTASNALFSGPVATSGGLSNTGVLWTHSLCNAGALTSSNALFSGPIVALAGLSNAGAMWTQSLSNAGALTSSNALFSGPIVALAGLSNTGTMWTQSLSNAGVLTASNALFTGPVATSAGLSNTGTMWTQSLSNSGVLTASNAVFKGPVVSMAGLSNPGTIWSQTHSNSGALTSSNALFSGLVATGAGLSNTGTMWTQALSNTGVLTASNAVFTGPVISLAGLSNPGTIWSLTHCNAGLLTSSNAVFSGLVATGAGLSNAGTIWTQALSNTGVLTASSAVFTGSVVVGTSAVTNVLPVSAMTSNTFTSSSNTTYVASQSPTCVNAAWNSFCATNAGTAWFTSSQYSASTGLFTGSTTTLVSGAACAGEWMQLQMPSTASLMSYSVSAIAGPWLSFAPISWVLAGSGDGGVTWTLLDTQASVAAWTSVTPRSYTITAVCATMRLIATAVTVPQTSAMVGTLNFFKATGTVLTATTASAQLGAFCNVTATTASAQVGAFCNVTATTASAQLGAFCNATSATLTVGSGVLNAYNAIRPNAVIALEAADLLSSAANGGAVSVWGAYYQTSSNAPVFSTSAGPGGGAAVVFTAALAQQMSLSRNVPANFAANPVAGLTPGMTMAWVGRWDGAVVSYEEMFVFTNPSTAQFIEFNLVGAVANAANSLVFNLGSTSVGNSAAAAVNTLGQWFTYGLRYLASTGAIAFYVNGAVVSTATSLNALPNTTLSANACQMGACTGNGQVAFNGAMSALYMWDSFIPDAQWSAATAYLMAGSSGVSKPFSASAFTSGYGQASANSATFSGDAARAQYAMVTANATIAVEAADLGAAGQLSSTAVSAWGPYVQGTPAMRPTYVATGGAPTPGGVGGGTGAAVVFNASNNTVLSLMASSQNKTVANIASNAGFTVAVCARVDVFNTNQRLFWLSLGNGNTQSLLEVVANAAPLIYVPTANAYAAASVSLGTWNVYGVRYSAASNVATFTLNGVSPGTLTTLYTLSNTVWNAAAGVTIGAQGTGSCFSGAVSGVYVWDSYVPDTQWNTLQAYLGAGAAGVVKPGASVTCAGLANSGTSWSQTVSNAGTLSTRTAAVTGYAAYSAYTAVTANAIFALEAADLATSGQTNGTAVATWGPFSQAAASSRPTYSAVGGAQFGGNPGAAVVFNLSNFLTLSAATPAAIATNAGFSMAVCARIDTYVQYQRLCALIASTAGGAAYLLVESTVSSNMPIVLMPSLNVFGAVNVTFGSWNVYGVRYTTSTNYFTQWLNGVVTSGTNTTSYTLSNTTLTTNSALGADFSSGGFLSGAVSGVYVWDSYVPDAQWTALNAYLVAGTAGVVKNVPSLTCAGLCNVGTAWVSGTVACGGLSVRSATHVVPPNVTGSGNSNSANVTFQQVTTSMMFGTALYTGTTTTLASQSFITMPVTHNLGTLNYMVLTNCCAYLSVGVISKASNSFTLLVLNITNNSAYNVAVGGNMPGGTQVDFVILAAA